MDGERREADVRSMSVADSLLRQHRQRAAVLLGGVVVIAAAAASRPVHDAVQAGIDAAEGVIATHAVAGAVLFVVLSALSAMVVFFSTAVITPVAIDAYGTLPTLFLLWLGWVGGGVAAYAIGHFYGHRVAAWFIDPERLREYEARARGLVRFNHVLLFQLAVPSEIPGYVLGLAGCRFRTYLAGVALAELPFAIGAVYLGESFLHRDYLLVLAIGIAGVALTWFAFRRVAAAW
jgi:uncharacterized membrane protein YdjX (TVP38/TMEM64 family)